MLRLVTKKDHLDASVQPGCIRGSGRNRPGMSSSLDPLVSFEYQLKTSNFAVLQAFTCTSTSIGRKPRLKSPS